MKEFGVFCLIFLFHFNVDGQEIVEYGRDSSLYELSSVSFRGNNKTKESYLRFHLSLDIGEFYSKESIQDHVLHLSRLSGIYNIQCNIQETDAEEKALSLVVNIEEQKTLLPVLNFGRAENYRWYQIGLVDINLLGKGNELFAYYQNNGGRHAGQIFYRKPQILKSRFGYSVNLMKWSSVEPLYFDDNQLYYDYDNDLVGLSAYYKYNRLIDFEIGTAYFKETYNRRDLEVDIIGAPINLNLSKGLLKLALMYNGLFFDGTFVDGQSFNLTYQFVETFDNSEFFNVIEGEYKYFKTFKATKIKGNLAIRSVLGISTNSDSPFSPFVIDSYKNVRGVGDRVQRGTALFSFNAEYRHLIWSSKQWAIQGISFLDMAAIRLPGKEMKNVFQNNQHNEFAGVGTRLIYKKIFNGLLRIDYGVDLSDMSNRHFVIGLGQYF